MLILFDVDATLITTSRTGIAAMGAAGRALFGEGFDETKVEYAGRLDPLIIGDLLRAHGREVTPAAVEAFRAGYRDHLARLLVTPGLARPCPGVLELLAALERAGTHALGLLTGNYPETGVIKLRASGVEPDRFAIHVWASDCEISPPAREHLPPVGMKRYAARYGRPVDPKDVVIVGDTPHDVACARAHGCRSLAVATGMFKVDELRSAGADHALQDLSNTAEVVAWLTRSR
jgi:phosphoglycolate phosphatase-like HAD superfamily hydrolase